MKRIYSNKRQLPLVLVWTSLLMVGCASTKETVLPQDGPTMKSIYDQHMVDVQKPGPSSRDRWSAVTAIGYRALPRLRAGSGQRDRYGISPPAQPRW